MHNTHLMTNNKFDLDSIILSSLGSNDIHDVSSLYELACGNGYKKTKRSFERELNKSEFFPKNLFKHNNEKIKDLVFKYWQNLIKKKRYLSLSCFNHNFKGTDYIFFIDSRGKKFWLRVKQPSVLNLEKALLKAQKYSNNTIVVWPSEDLIDIFKSIVHEKGSEKIFNVDGKQTYIPLSSYYSKLTTKDLYRVGNNSFKKSVQKLSLSHLERIESEAIHIIRETVSEATNPVMLYSIGKDSAVMLHLARKAFYPAPPPFPLLHVDTGWKFNEMYQFRDLIVKDAGMELIVFKNKDGLSKGINPFDHGSEIHTDIMKTQALKEALDFYGFDFAFGGARRDEEKSRAKERILSFRSSSHVWDPKNQRPELWDLYNYNKNEGETARVFPISNWTELDIWQYIYKESIPIVPLYFSLQRPFVNRDGTLLMIDDDRFMLNKGEEIKILSARFRTLGCYPLTAAVESNAKSITDILLELIDSNTSERDGRLIDTDSAGSMEKKKKEGYF